jgi:hypothetical protein
MSALLDHWVEVGFITRAQAERIRSEPASAIPRPTPAPAPALAPAERTSLVTEALGYLGGVLILVARGSSRRASGRTWRSASGSGSSHQRRDEVTPVRPAHRP